ncbi:hypothetical protein AMATHDRAFT_141454 [Amanita thiersii Skay4041]|uniref:ZIP zinc/iron transport family n=1 Tax=Amanita thiersii Skay4041 TaxID=703135 RepID=A0A2A9NUI4_9AGAR|nr:hypothetical protein AMATHDRAFT_141454 [Amanita thiersii Skay4041]
MIQNRADEILNCDSGGGSNTFMGLRIASIFIIMAGSMGGALFPVLAKRSSWMHVPTYVFDFAKYFGSGVIIATAFIHLLAPALEALGSECLSEAWHQYPYALALCLVSIFAIFIAELIAFRLGTAKLKHIGIHHDAHGHNHGSHVAHGPEGTDLSDEKRDASSDLESVATHVHDHDAAAQIVGVAILEFGVALHSVLIGLTLAVDEAFKVLFVVLVFHQTFEGLGIGSRLAYMKLPQRYHWVPVAGAVLYGLTTPIGIAVGLGARTTYNPGSTTASIVSGVLDSLSAGILLYTGLVELLAHEFLFNKEMLYGPTRQIVYAISCMCLGCGLMALLGRWA